MKKIYLYITILLITGLCSVSSCSKEKNKAVESQEISKPKDLEDLSIKYKVFEISNCDDLLVIGNEMIDVYIETVNRAYDGSERAKSDLLDFDIFKNKFENEFEKIATDCPERTDEWKENTEKRISEVSGKISSILKTENYDYIDFDDSILYNLDIQLKELSEDVNKFLQNDTILEDTLQ